MSMDRPCVCSKKTYIWQSSQVSMMWCMQCVSVRGDLNHHRYNKRVGFAKFWGFYVKLMFVECRLILSKSRKFYVKETQVESWLILPKSKFFVHGLRVYFTKVQVVFCKIYVPNYSWPLDQPTRWSRCFGVTRPPSGARECTRISMNCSTCNTLSVC